MIRNLMLITIAGLVCATSGCTTSKRSREQAMLRMQVGTGHLEKRNYPLALRELQAAVELDPRNPMIHNNLGLAYFYRDRMDLAEASLRKALELSPTYQEARDNLGRVLIERGQYEEAIRELRIALSDLTYPYPDRALTNLGLAHFKRADFGQARASFAQAIQANRENCLAHTLYGRSLLEVGDFRAASESLDNAIRVCQGNQFDEPHYFSALSYLKVGDTGRGQARLEEAIKLFPHGKYAQRAKSMLQQIR